MATQEIVLDQNLDAQKSLAWWLYIFHGASLVFSMGMLSFIPLIINYIKRQDAAGTFVYTHHSWQIRSFWWYVIWMAVGGVLFLTVIGIPLAFAVFGVAWIWKAYRVIRGFIALNDNQPMPV